MKIGLIDVEKYYDPEKKFPNIPLMKISSYHKAKGDHVEWYNNTHYDIVYISKVFSFTDDYPEWLIDADQIIKGGSGYAIIKENGIEVYHKELDQKLPECIECQYPDYDLYNITDTAYGFITRGCPRGCDFCHVKDMQGKKPYRVAKLSSFWNGQKNIVLLDPNITAYREWKEVFQELIDSKSFVDFSQGLDIRCMTREKAEMLKKIKIKGLHFAWDRYEDKDIIMLKLKEFQEVYKGGHKVVVYVLVNFNTTLEQDLERVMFIRSLNFTPYIMRYDKQNIKTGHILNSLARWCNMPAVFWKYATFQEYIQDNIKNNKHLLDQLNQSKKDAI